MATTSVTDEAHLELYPQNEEPSSKELNGESKDDGGQGQGCSKKYFRSRSCLLLAFSVVGVALGFGIGFALYFLNTSKLVLVWIGLPGELFLRILKAAVLPLIVCSIITGTSGLKPRENGRVSVAALGYMIFTNIIGGVIGTILAVIVRPGGAGRESKEDDSAVDTGNLQTSDLFADLIRNFFPDNVVTACFQKTQTRYEERPGASNHTELVQIVGTSGGMNILGLVVVCMAIGMAASRTGEAAKPFLDFFRATTEVVFKLFHWIIWLTPIGALSLIAKAVGGSSDVVETFRGLGLFVLAETVGSVAIMVIMVPILYLVFLRKNPFLFILDASRTVVTTFAAASSTVSMPQAISCLDGRDVDPRVSRFVAPLAVSINRDGSTMFIALTSLFIAQLQGVDTPDTILLVTVLAIVGSLAIPGVPSASVVTILMILASLDIPPANIGIILALEWYSDRIRSSANALSHVLCGVITWHLCRSALHAEVHKSRQETVVSADTDTKTDNGFTTSVQNC